MIGNLQKQNLRGAKQQRRLDQRRLRRQPTFEHWREQMPQRAKPAKHHANERANQGAIPLGQ